MTKQIITLSDNAAQRIKEIMSNAEKDSLGVRVGVKSCLLYTSPSPRDP